MSKKLPFCLLTVFLNLIIIHPSFAQTLIDFSTFSLSVEQWQTKADTSWQISFNSSEGKTESELIYNDTAADIISLKARYRPIPQFSVGANAGFGGIDNAHYTDIDRTDGADWSESQGDVDGKVVQYGADVYVHMFPVHRGDQLLLDFFAGYQHYEDQLRMFNGRQTRSEPPSANALGPFAGLNSNYDFEWNYLRLGAEIGYEFIARPKIALNSLALRSMIGLIPYVAYEGTGVWNLRSDFAQNPSFRHYSNTGVGFDVSLALSYSPCKGAEFIGGYRYLHLQVFDGTDTTYGSDGSIGRAKLDEVTLDRSGPFFALAVKF
ncbi:MAG: hypothetical protein HZA78_11205 [Candidatus Schekmanbacteria bacterium]|nr:hypothetical protein [Candidatus Schekmanbacteria bacterium]